MHYSNVGNLNYSSIVCAKLFQIFLECRKFYFLQTLSKDFRLNYCRLWLAIIQADLQNIKTYAAKMGVEQLYPLFACILSGRSWKAVTTGIDKHSFTADEV